MSFTSLEFLFLLIPTFVTYYTPCLRKYQVLILILSSFIFYAWNSPQLLILLLISISIDTVTSYKISHSVGAKRIRYALIGIAFNLLVLSIFKYGNLVASSIAQLFSNQSDSKILSLLIIPLPIGISFYTFEGISLLVDTFKGKEITQSRNTPIEHLLKTSLFVCFFPHLIAGPILKAHRFYQQIQKKYFSKIDWYLIFRSLVVGYFLKMVIADNLKDYTFWITFPYYQSLSTQTGLILLFGYSIQIFADFAGYSLIAIGTAAAFGYNLPQNFNFPYLSCSLSEFWSRWHISLSSWLKDYLYIPLGGNRKGELRTYLNLIVVMLFGGLWHGAAWSYAVWGGYHGLGLAIERLLKERIEFGPLNVWQQSILNSIKLIWVFCFVSFGWLLFKLPKFEEAVGFVTSMIYNTSLPNNTYGVIPPTLLFSTPVIVYHFIHHPLWERWKSNNNHRLSLRVWDTIDDLVLGIMLALIILNSGSSNEFIYFQF